MSQMDGSPLDTGKAIVARHCDGAVCDASTSANNSSPTSSACGACNGGIRASEILCHVRLPLCDCRGDTLMVRAFKNTGNSRDCT